MYHDPLLSLALAMDCNLQVNGEYTYFVTIVTSTQLSVGGRNIVSLLPSLTKVTERLSDIGLDIS